MKKIIFSYLVPYLITVSLTLVAWLATIWFYEGWVPVLAGLAFIGALLFTVPYLLHEDYKRIKRVVTGGYDAYKDKDKRDGFYELMVTEIVTVLGVPDFVAEWGVKRAMAKMQEFKT
jgi:hypothetical protein